MQDWVQAWNLVWLDSRDVIRKEKAPMLVGAGEDYSELCSEARQQLCLGTLAPLPAMEGRYHHVWRAKDELI